jgi:general secretion pathway protein C
MSARITAFAVWALLAASVVFWLLKLTVSPLPAPADTVAVVDGAPSRVDLTRLLGSTPVSVAVEAAVAVESRFRLVGVLAPKKGWSAAEGVALIAIDGAPAKPYRVGANIESDLQLLSLTARSAALGVAAKPDSPQVVLQLAPPNAAINQPIVKPAAALNALASQGGSANVLAPGGRIAAVPMTPGLNPVPTKEDEDDAPAASSAEPRRGAALSSNATR